jgi:hypothetical protein
MARSFASLPNQMIHINLHYDIILHHITHYYTILHHITSQLTTLQLTTMDDFIPFTDLKKHGFPCTSFEISLTLSLHVLAALPHAGSICCIGVNSS